MTTATRGAAGTLLAGVLLLAVPGTAAAQWEKSTDWLLLCTTYLEATFGADSPMCDEAHQAGGVKLTLDEASRWLERLGFDSPALSANLDLATHMQARSEAWQDAQLASQRDPRCEVRYCAWLLYGLGGDGAYSPRDSSLVLDPFNVTQDGVQPGYDEGFGFAEVHELFHAVQFGYPSIEEGVELDWIDWLIEGSAQHVARMAGARQGMTTSGAVWHRTYDQSLHVPPIEDVEAAGYRAWAYGSELFFDFVGEHLGSQDRVAYLDAVLERIDTGEIDALVAIDGVLRGETGKGLYDAFPEFVRARLDRPCYFSHLGTWRGGGCAESGDNEHRFDLPFPDTILREHRAADVGANGYLVRMDVPEDAGGRLVVRVPPGRDAAYLHLVVGDERRDAVGIESRRNEFTARLGPGHHEYMVRLVNVPEDVTSEDATAGLDFSADDPAPIEFTLERVDNAYEFVVEGDVASALAGRLAINGNLMAGGRCLVQLWFHSATGEPIVHSSLRIEAVLSEGFRTGEFSFGHKTSMRHGVQDMMATPDVFFAELGAEDTPFRSLAGTISITRQGTSLVTGTFALEAEEVEPWDLSYQRHASVRGNFVAPLLEDGDMFGQHYRCPTPE